jgi:hypothetical protein
VLDRLDRRLAAAPPLPLGAQRKHQGRDVEEVALLLRVGVGVRVRVEARARVRVKARARVKGEARARVRVS